MTLDCLLLLHVWRCSARPGVEIHPLNLLSTHICGKFVRATDQRAWVDNGRTQLYPYSRTLGSN